MMIKFCGKLLMAAAFLLLIGIWSAGKGATGPEPSVQSSDTDFTLLLTSLSSEPDPSEQSKAPDLTPLHISSSPDPDPSGQSSVQNRKETVATLETWLEDGFRYWQQVRDVPALISFYAERQLGIEYEAGLLDEPDEERLVVTLDGSDCVIYVEMSLALAMTTLQGRQSAGAFRENLTLLRYREGEIDGYMSRLHYFSNWLLTNRDKGLLTILFQEEELPLMDPVHFMSDNRESYRHLAEDDSKYQQKKQVEALLSERDLRYIPQEKIPEYASQFQTGDVLAFVTTIEGLDITHTALVKMDGDRAGFYHASTSGGVIVDSATIHEYARGRDNVNGIIVARLRSPRE